MSALLHMSPQGWFCPIAQVHIDPIKPVRHAFITHGHADHVRPGNLHYCCTRSARPVIRQRLGPVSIETLEYGEKRLINGVQFSFHPAGHILGSAQIRVEYQGEIWVVSGDYKLENDGWSEPFEPVQCHTFLSECTFGLPEFQWRPQAEIFKEINEWWQENRAAGRVSILAAYALGKAQRVLRGLDGGIGPIFCHASIENINEVLQNQGVKLPDHQRLRPKYKLNDLRGALILVPPVALGDYLIKRLGDQALGVASGWSGRTGFAQKYPGARGFELSDHADFAGLNEAVRASGAQRLIPVHGYVQEFGTYWKGQGMDAIF
jgi:putative mRNA 3-end processing factor